MKIQVFQETYELKSESDLRSHLNYRFKDNYGAFWLCTVQPELALFVNGSRSWLMHMPLSSDHRYSKNPDIDAKEENEVDFYIENYQLDQVSELMLVKTELAVEVMVGFYKTSQLSNKILWE